MYPFSNYVQYMRSEGKKRKLYYKSLNCTCQKAQLKDAGGAAQGGISKRVMTQKSRKQQIQISNAQQQREKPLGLNLLLVLGAHGHRVPVARNARVLVA